MEPTVWTVGHSTRSLAELCALLREHGVRVYADIRRWPASRRNPQHARESLARALARAGIQYEWWGDRLGGYRKELLAEADSPNRGWTTPGFRHVADYLLTEEGQAALDALERLVRAEPTAFACAEAHPSRCHRRIVADHLAARGLVVVHLIGPGRTEAHLPPPFARLQDRRVTYPGRATGLQQPLFPGTD